MHDSIKRRGQVLNRAIVLVQVQVQVQVIKARADCSKSMKFEHSMLSTISKMLDSNLASDCSDICTMQVQHLHMRLYVKCT